MVYHVTRTVKGDAVRISGERKDARPRHRDRALFDRMFPLPSVAGGSADNGRDLPLPRPDGEERRRPTAGKGEGGRVRRKQTAPTI